MADIAKSVLDRLKQKGRTTGKSQQLLLQLFCQEEFLRRMNQSNYKDNFILKGGLFLYCLNEFQGRPTMDIDFLMRRLSNNLENIQEVIQEIIMVPSANNFIQYTLLGTEVITEQREYHGIRVKLMAKIKNTRTPLDIDIGIGDVIVPKPIVRKIPTQLEGFEVPEILTYSLESTIAEKFDAILQRMELSSRMKDYYDIFDLLHRYSFDARSLQEAIFETLQHRGTIYEADSLRRISTFHENPTVLKNWNNFSKRTLQLDLQFETVLENIYRFLAPIYDAMVNEIEFHGTWNSNMLQYEVLKEE